MFKLVILTCAVAAASGGLLAPLAYSVPILPSNYRGPLSLAPGQPANILAADGRPLDTLDVNLDRSAHFTAKAFNGLHLLKKRSAPLLSAPVISPVAFSQGPVLAPAASVYSAGIAAPYVSPIAKLGVTSFVNW
ncbi:uncharacterized protein LOC113521992 [Galleria mellonella]|uniref:Uncharacterized protein LOC113521992 n=1 Tax=Galleria mellonella TaxID=7137 RepID=A0A6J1X255_GALME|nr:uncharacterized protein LOC113521992 [Galleria mellonella]